MSSFDPFVDSHLSKEPDDRTIARSGSTSSERDGYMDTMEDNSGPRTFNPPSRQDSSSYYNLQKMNQLHHENVRRIVVGQKDHIIADSLNVSKAMVKYTRESPVVKQKLDIMMGARAASSVELQKQIQALAPLALHEMTKIMTDEKSPHGVRAGIGKDILDRAGFKPANVNIDATDSFNEERIEKLKERARLSGVVVEDAEFVEEDEAFDDG